MTGRFEFPPMRAEVMEALRALSDPEHQFSKWGRYEPGVEYYDDLDMNVHILYDDVQVLPDPASAVSSVLDESEISAMQALHAALGEMIRDLGDVSDAIYLSDPRWPAAIRAAQGALVAMNANDDGHST